MIAKLNFKPTLLSYVKYSLILIAFLFSSIVVAQNNDAMYYKKEYYKISYSKTITYKTAKDFRGNNITLQADLNYPGDASDNSENVKRPAVILYHGGGFFPPGGRNNAINKQFSDYFNKRGFVAIPASYRLGWNYKGKGIQDVLTACFTTNPEDYKDAMYRAFQDSRDLVRYLKDHADEFNIDPNAIFVLGYSAGAILALTHLGDDTEMFNADRAKRLGPMPMDEKSTQVAGVISIAGAHTMPDAQYRNVPTVFFHGTCDFAVPYDGDAKMIACPRFPKTYGPDVISENLKKQNIFYEMYSFCGYDHDFLSKGEPATTKMSKGLQFVVDETTEFMNKVINGNAAQSKEVTVTALSEFPNTAAKGGCAKSKNFEACNGSLQPITITNTNNKPIPNLRNELYPNVGQVVDNNNNTNQQEYPEFPLKFELVEKEVSIYEAIQVFVSTPKSTTLTIDVFNIVGAKIAQNQVVVNAGESVINLNSGEWNEGNYVITISEGGEAKYVDFFTLKDTFF